MPCRFVASEQEAVPHYIAPAVVGSCGQVYVNDLYNVCTTKSPNTLFSECVPIINGHIIVLGNRLPSADVPVLGECEVAVEREGKKPHQT